MAHLELCVFHIPEILFTLFFKQHTIDISDSLDPDDPTGNGLTYYIMCRCMTDPPFDLSLARIEVLLYSQPSAEPITSVSF